MVSGISISEEDRQHGGLRQQLQFFLKRFTFFACSSVSWQQCKRGKWKDSQESAGSRSWGRGALPLHAMYFTHQKVSKQTLKILVQDCTMFGAREVGKNAVFGMDAEC